MKKLITGRMRCFETRNLAKVIVLLGTLGASLAAVAVEPVVDANWVKAHACDRNVRVLDLRNAPDGGSKADYLKGHIPCAVYTDYRKDGWRSTVDNVPGQLSNPDDLARIIGNLGIGNDTHVVLVHGGRRALDMAGATRLYWTFKVLGHDQVSILDGGYRGYASDAGNAIEKGDNLPEPRSFSVSLRTEMIATKEDVKMAIEDNSAALVDLRPLPAYAGISRYLKLKRFSTIPSAKNFPQDQMAVNGGFFRSTAELQQLYAAADLKTTGKQISFCYTGHWASLGWFVSSELLGNPEATLYDGSMAEWGADASLPTQPRVPSE